MPNQNPQYKMSDQEAEYLSRLYQSQYMIVTNSINEAISDLQQLNSTARSLDNMGMIAGKDSFYPVGPDTYMQCSMSKSENVIIGVGSGYMVETTATNAKDIIRSKIEKQKKMLERLTKAKKELESAISGLSKQ